MFLGILTQPATAASIADVEGGLAPGVAVATTEVVVALGTRSTGEESAKVRRDEMARAEVKDFIFSGCGGSMCLRERPDFLERITA